MLEFKQYNIYIWWIPSLNYRIEYLVFEVNGYHIIWVLYQNLDNGSTSFVKKDVVFNYLIWFSHVHVGPLFDFGLARVGDVLIWKLESKFLAHGVMNVLDIVYA